jgi:hypothetical protein
MHSRRRNLSSVLIISFFFVACNQGYKVDGHRVFYDHWNEGTGSHHELIFEADSRSFETLDHPNYAKDKNFAYYKGKIIRGADTRSFRSILDYYAVDDYGAFYKDKKIKGADGKTFQVIEKGPYARDKFDYYYNSCKMNVSDLPTFQILDESWSKDKQFCFIQAMSDTVFRYPLRESYSFELLDGGYAKDKYQVYFFGVIVKEADPSTFKVSGVGKAKDKNHCFIREEIITCN